MNTTEDFVADIRPTGPGSPTSARAVLRAELKSLHHSTTHRRLGQDLVWSWARDKWPSLVPPQTMLLANVERTLADKSLIARSSADRRTWGIQIAYRESKSFNIWTTRATITDTGEVSVFALETTCTDCADSRPLAPPAFLKAWVRRLDLQDGGIPVVQEPRFVENDEDVAAFEADLLDSRRQLPLVALVSRPQVRYYGVDPGALAEAVCGLAHVVCFTPAAAARLAEKFGRGLAPAHGFARFYLHGFAAESVSRDHFLMRLPTAQPGEEHEPPSAGATRRLIVRRICELSVAA